MCLLDTHLVLWSAFEPDRLSPRAGKLLRSRDKPIAFSLATIWEVAIKTSLGRPGFSVDPSRLRLALLVEVGLQRTAHPARTCGPASRRLCHGFTAIRLTGCWWPRRPKKG
jgi:hypothetical protein